MASLALALAGLTGCAKPRVSIPAPPPSPQVEPFERALMTYVRAEKEPTEEALFEALHREPLDERARELLVALWEEHGRDGKEPPPAPGPGERAALAGPLEPSRVLRIVLGRSPELRQAVQRVIEARALLREANVSHTPEFRLLTRFHPVGVFASLTQSLFGGYWQRKAEMEEAEARVLEALADYARIRTEVEDRALAAYFDLLEARELAEVLGREGTAREETLRVVEVLARFGARLDRDVLAARHQLETTRRRRVEAERRASLARATLNALMNRDVAEPIRVVPRRLSMAAPASLERALAIALRRRAEIRQAEAAAEAGRAGKKIVATDLPRVDLRATYGQTEEEGRGDFLEGESVGLVFATPILIWPLQEARGARQQALVRELELEVERMEHDVAVEVVSTYEGLLEAEAAREEWSRRMVASREARRVARIVSRWGERGSPLQPLEADVLETEARAEWIRADYAVERARVALHRATGVLPERLSFGDVVSSPGDDHGPVPRERGRALWVWDSEALSSPEEREFLVDFAEARDIATLFVFVSTRELARNPARYESLCSLAHSRQLSVHALNGEPQWPLDEGRLSAMTYLATVSQHHVRVTPDRRFDAVHLDVEPHVLADWDQRREEVAVAYVRFLEAARRALPPDLRLVIDVPAWWESVSVGSRSLLEAVTEVADGVVVMAYERSASRVIESMSEEMQLAGAGGKAIWVGVRAKLEDLGVRLAEGQSLEARFEEELSAIVEALSGLPEFRGVALHDYRDYQELLLDPGW